jgi:hypothetical protein
LPTVSQAPVISHPDAQPAVPNMPGAPQSEADFSDIAAPEQATAPRDDTHPNDVATTPGGEIALGLRHVMGGIGTVEDLADYVNPISISQRIIDAATGSHFHQMPSQAGVKLADELGMPNDSTDAEKLVGKSIEGATGGALLGPGEALPMALSGAGAGGASELARQNGVGPMGQLYAGLAGGIAAPGALAGAGRLAGAVAGSRAPNAFLQAARTAGLQDHILPADAGGPVVRALSAGAMQTPFGAPAIIKGAEGLNAASAGKIAEQAAARGEIQSGETLGDTIRAAITKVIASSRNAPGALYRRATELAGDTPIDLKNARDVTDGHITRLKATAQTGSIPAQLADLRQLRAELDRPLTMQGVRDMRTEMFVAPDLRGTPAEARLKSITDAAHEDIVDSLNANGKGDAAAAAQQADGLWKQRLDLIDKVFKPIIGPSKMPRSSEDVVKSIHAAMKGNANRFGVFVHSLPDEEQGIVRASLISPLGKDKDGVFSLSRFSDNWRDIAPGAKAALFGKESTDALDAVATVGREAKEAMRFANHSNTTRGLEVGRLLTYITALPSLGATVAGQVVAGKLLASPRFARWLASSANKPNAAAQLAHIDRLTAIAASQPVIANDVLALQSRLQASFPGPQSITAQPQQDRRGQ